MISGQLHFVTAGAKLLGLSEKGYEAVIEAVCAREVDSPELYFADLQSGEGIDSLPLLRHGWVTEVAL